RYLEFIIQYKDLFNSKDFLISVQDYIRFNDEFKKINPPIQKVYKIDNLFRDEATNRIKKAQKKYDKIVLKKNERTISSCNIKRTMDDIKMRFEIFYGSKDSAFDTLFETYP